MSFWSGDNALAAQMVGEILRLEPDRRHIVVAVGRPEVGNAELIALEPGSPWQLYRHLRRRLRKLRIGLAPVLFSSGPHPLQTVAFWLAPRKILAYNARLERHHLRVTTGIASWLFLRSVPLDRIFLRPWWLWPWRRDRSEIPATCRILEGRPLSPDRGRIAVLSPYFPYPLSHGGAVRIFNLLREASREFDIFLFAFTEGEPAPGPVVEFCAKVILAGKPRYREPRWSSLTPPEVNEYRSPTMRSVVARLRREYHIDLLQVEYTQLASYGGDILVEHDVTFDLHAQILRQERTRSAWWNYVRWRRFETRAMRRYRRVVVMSSKDAGLLPLKPERVRVIENGVDLDRFQPQPEEPGLRLLFVGSFRHFPNVAAYRFFTEKIWPDLRAVFPEMKLTVVAGAGHLLYWREFAPSQEPPRDEQIRMLGFVEDVRPLYAETNLVIVPTTISAGTNIKVLEAMAMERALVSTSSGCAGLGLEHGSSVWIADDPAGFAEGVTRLLRDPSERLRLARSARRLVEQRFGWRALGEKQRALYRELG